MRTYSLSLFLRVLSPTERMRLKVASGSYFVKLTTMLLYEGRFAG
jgi:hypothetical protein